MPPVKTTTFRATGHGSIDILLPEEQLETVSKHDFSTLYDVGFVPPESIQSYVCKKCNKEYKQPPIAEVFISVMFDEGGKAGVIYRCAACGDAVFYSHLTSPEGIDPKYITFDATGNWKRPTPEDVESMLQKAEAGAAGGCGNPERGLYRDDLRQAAHWAKVLQPETPGLITKERVRGMKETYRNAFIKKAEEDLPELVERILEQDYAFNLTSMEEEGGITPYEGTGLCEHMNELLETLPLISPPTDSDVRRGILRALNLYIGMHDDRKKALEEKRNELDKEIDAFSATIDKAEVMRRQYLDRAELTLNEVTEAEEES